MLGPLVRVPDVVHTPHPLLRHSVDRISPVPGYTRILPSSRYVDPLFPFFFFPLHFFSPSIPPLPPPLFVTVPLCITLPARPCGTFFSTLTALT